MSKRAHTLLWVLLAIAGGVFVVWEVLIPHHPTTMLSVRGEPSLQDTIDLIKQMPTPMEFHHHGRTEVILNIHHDQVLLSPNPGEEGPVAIPIEIIAIAAIKQQGEFVPLQQ